MESRPRGIRVRIPQKGVVWLWPIVVIWAATDMLGFRASRRHAPGLDDPNGLRISPILFAQPALPILTKARTKKWQRTIESNKTSEVVSEICFPGISGSVDNLLSTKLIAWLATRGRHGLVRPEIQRSSGIFLLRFPGTDGEYASSGDVEFPPTGGAWSLTLALRVVGAIYFFR